MAKGRDNEIVRALQNVPEGHSMKFEIEFCAVTGLQV